MGDAVFGMVDKDLGPVVPKGVVVRNASVLQINGNLDNHLQITWAVFLRKITVTGPVSTVP